MQTEALPRLKYPNLISKYELRTALRCASNHEWRYKYFPDQVLSEILGVDRVQFNKIRQFDAIQTQKIISFFQLEPKDFTI